MSKKVKFKFVTLALTILMIFLLILSGYYLKNNDGHQYKREIYSVTETGNINIKKLVPLKKAILTASTISTNLKKIIASIETVNLANINSYIDKIKPVFDEQYFEKFAADKKAEAKFLLDMDVRVISFVVTEQPILVGVDIHSKEPHWLFRIKGDFTKDGVFSKALNYNSFGEKVIWVTIKENIGQNGNPAGIKIINYESE